MDRSKWENVIVNFQAFARGYLVRNEIRRAREDFEDIVEEIDGGLSHLQWRDTVVSTPHFTDTHGPLPRARTSTLDAPDTGLNVSASPRTSSAEADTLLPQERGRDPHVLLEKIEAERDESQTKDKDCDSRAWNPFKHAAEDGQRQRREQQGDDDGGAMESTGDSTSMWSSLDLDMNYGHFQKDTQQVRLAQDVPRTPEALCVHRNTLTMELVWLQQAIDSRKKYLSLRDKLSIS